MRVALPFALFLMGFTFTITQVLVIRELLVVFLGNELSIAIVLANWLLLEAAGSFLLGRRIGGGATEKGFAFLQWLLWLLLPLTIVGIRFLRDGMGLSIGEGASLLQIFLWTAMVLAPLGLVDGILFAWACTVHSRFTAAAARSIGKVYFYEGLGAGVGGIVYTFLLIPRFHSFEVALLLGMANLLSGILLLSVGRNGTTSPGQDRRAARPALAGLLWICLTANGACLALSCAGSLEKITLERQWKGLDILASRWSPYGNVTVGRREEQLTFFSNGIPVCNAPAPNIAFAEELVHYPLLSLPAPKAILIIGGGPGGVIAEALKHPLAEVHYAEIDPLMIQALRDHPTPLTLRELEHPRVRIHTVDGRLYMKTAARRFDAIILNLPPPATLELNRFYTAEFFAQMRRSLSDGGVAVLHLPGSETYLSRETRDLTLSVRQSLLSAFPSVHLLPGEIHLFLAFASAAAAPSPDTLIGRLRERGLPTQFFREPHIRLKLEPSRIQWLEDSLGRGAAVRPNRDAQPFGLYYAIAHWNAQFHPALQVFWRWVAQLHLWHLAAMLLILACAAWLAGKGGRENRRGRVLVWVVGSTGYFGTATAVLLIFVFQTLYGHAYHLIGLLIAFFMAGLALGSGLMNRRLAAWHNPGASLAFMELLIFLFTAGLMTLLALAYSSGLPADGLSSVTFGFTLASAGAGCLVGLEFTLAARLFSGSGQGVSRAAGTLYAADLFGAFWGSLMVGVVLVPALGILQTLSLTLFLKAATLVLTRLAWSRSGPAPQAPPAAGPLSG
jgi:spermidine synthase